MLTEKLGTLRFQDHILKLAPESKRIIEESVLKCYMGWLETLRHDDLIEDGTTVTSGNCVQTVSVSPDEQMVQCYLS